MVEVTAEHEAVEQVRAGSERNAVLVAELQHRTRNLLGLVRSMARRILETSPSADEFHARLDERLGALSRVQGLLSRAEAPAVDLRDLIRLELSAVGVEGEERRVQLGGPPIGLPFLTVQTMSLAIHELATNARKHGALAAPEGSLLVTWTLEQTDGAAPTLVLDWREKEIPPQEEDVPPRSGYGRELIERALPYQLGAATQLELEDGRLRCRIALPLHHSSEDDHDERNAT
nr:sensor histidine kinase [Geminicoccus roseus]